MTRAVRPGGVVAIYVWDYAGKMELMRYFWDAAVALDPEVSKLAEGLRFPICQPPALLALFSEAGLRDVQTHTIDAPTTFRDFDDYWNPFLGGQGPAAGASAGARAAAGDQPGAAGGRAAGDRHGRGFRAVVNAAHAPSRRSSCSAPCGRAMK